MRPPASGLSGSKLPSDWQLLAVFYLSQPAEIDPSGLRGFALFWLMVSEVLANTQFDGGYENSCGLVHTCYCVAISGSGMNFSYQGFRRGAWVCSMRRIEARCFSGLDSRWILPIRSASL